MRLLNFKSYERLLLEAEGDDVSNIASQIASAFLDVYGAILPAAPGYAKIMNDLDSLVEGDAKAKMEAMKKIVDSITGAIPSQFSSTSDDFKKALEEVVKAYDILLSQEEGKEEGLKSISNAISRSVVRFSSSLKDAKKEVSESSSFRGKYELLMEAALHKNKRDDLRKTITSVKAGVDAKLEDKALSSMHPFLTNIQKELDEMIANVNDEKYWEGIKKRKDRIAELEKMAARLAEIGPEIDAKSMESLRRLNADKDIVSALSNSKKSLEDALKKFGEIQSEQMAEPEKSEEGQEGGEDKKDEEVEYSNIDPKDPQNLRRSGPNLEKIKDYQKKTNEILADSPGYNKIDEDGLYGQKTTDAFKRLQGVLNRLGAGLNADGALTAETQKVIDNFIKNKEAIREMIKK